MNAPFNTRHYLWAGNLLILGLVLWSAVGIGLSVLDHRLKKNLTAKPPVATAPGNAAHILSLAHYEAIARFNMFGAKAAGEASDAGGAADTAAQTSTGDFRLRGVIYDPAKGYAAAILENVRTGRQDLYRPGQRANGVELKQVGPDWVIVKQGRDEVRMDIFLEERAPAPKAGLKALPWGEPGGASDLDEVLAKSTGPGRWTVSRSVISRHMGDLNYFLANVLIKPHFQNGQPDGFLVASVKAGTPVHLLGLKRGDIVKKVNGVSVANPEDLVNMYRQVQQMESVTLGLERRGKPLTFTYTFK